jgi:hypothetical protein
MINLNKPYRRKDFVDFMQQRFLHEDFSPV